MSDAFGNIKNEGSKGKVLAWFCLVLPLLSFSIHIVFRCNNLCLSCNNLSFLFFLNDDYS